MFVTCCVDVVERWWLVGPERSLSEIRGENELLPWNVRYDCLMCFNRMDMDGMVAPSYLII
jgi:hypothetical protein